MKEFLLVMVMCANDPCTLSSAYVVDQFQAVEQANALGDCNAELESSGATELVCLTPDELRDLTGQPEPQASAVKTGARYVL